MTSGRHAGRRPGSLWTVVVGLLIVGGGLVALGGRTPNGPAVGGTARGSSGTSTPPAPGTSAGSPRSRGPLLLHGTGDVNLDPAYISSYASRGYAYAWAGLDGLFRRDDLTVVNLECAVSDLGSPVAKEFTFRGDPDALAPMRAAGVDVANLGNNHSYDFGPEALLDTVRNVEDARIEAVGAGATQDRALEPAMFDLSGWRVAVLGLDQVVDPFPEAVATASKPGTAAGHDPELMIDAIRAAAQRADLVVVMIHWGVELDTEPRAEQVDLGHRMIDAGADVIFGGHAHRLQPMETYRGRPIFHSLGNFVWPNLSVEGSETAVARVRVSPAGVVRGRLLPATITAPGHPELR